VRALIAEATRRTVDGVPLDARLDATGLGLDSLGLIKLSVRLEEAFEITMPDIAEYEGAASLATVLQLADFVAARVASRRVQ
jgi:acyl carrier protein